MSNEKKQPISAWMKQDTIARMDKLFSQHGCRSRSDYICRAVEFYNGFLQADGTEEYMSGTVLAFLEDKLAKLEARVCRQLFRMCVELAMASHVYASATDGIADEAMERLRKRCVKDVKRTVGSIRYDSIYAFQHDRFRDEEQEGDEGNE